MALAETAHGRRPGTRAGVARFGRVLVVRLGPGEDLLPAMEQILLDAEFESAAILSGVASLEQASVRNIFRLPASYPITSDDRRITTIPGPLEVLAMQGNVAPKEDGGLVIHCHADFSLGAPPAVTYGGHLIENTIVATTCELYVAELLDLEVRRKQDDVTHAPEIWVDPQLG